MLTEFEPNAERVTAVITSHLESGENFDGALAIGVYTGDNTEIWVQPPNGRQLNIQLADVDDLCRQLKRAKKIAAAQKSA